jgi:hypothetical protein
MKLRNLIGIGSAIGAAAIAVSSGGGKGTWTGEISDAIPIATIQRVCGDPDAPEGRIVYVFEGDVVLDDGDGASPRSATTTAETSDDAGAGSRAYRAIVIPGSEAVTFTCENRDELDHGSETLTGL